MYVIKDHIGYVSGFLRSMQIVQSTTHPDYIKKFKTEKAAQKFIDNYADCGYGLGSKDAKIEVMK